MPRVFALPFVAKLADTGSTKSVSFGDFTVAWSAAAATTCGDLTLRNASTTDTARYSESGDPGVAPETELAPATTTAPLVSGQGAFYFLVASKSGASGISGDVACSDGGGTGPVLLSGGLIGE